MIYILSMDIQFLTHNRHLEDPNSFEEMDPQLHRLKNQPYIYQSKLLKELPVETPGIYTVTGGRQVGKTTLLKQWMLKLLKAGGNPENIAFFSGELIDDQHVLLRIIQEQLSQVRDQSLNYLIVDEVTYIKNWEKAVKYAADAGLLQNVVLILTGSDSILIQEARMSFPGRRGTSIKNDFHLYPLSFCEVFELKKGRINKEELSAEKLYDEFKYYLQHGGYLTAINDLAKNKTIGRSTLMTYSDWIRGDMIKHGKQEHYLREIIGAIIKRYGSQVTWNALSRDLSIDHPKTVADYVELLASMDAAFIQAALLEDKLTAAPKKARKIMFTDPFIYHAMREWLNPTDDPYHQQIIPAVEDSAACGKIVEATVITHFRRHYPTYYIKAEGEVDIAYILDQKFWPIEIKWTNQIRAKDLKQINKYKNGKILAKNSEVGMINGVPTEFLLFALMNL